MGDILIVDDEKDIRELVSDILIDEGYTTDWLQTLMKLLNVSMRNYLS